MELKKPSIQVHKQFNQYQLLCLVKNESFDIKIRFIYLNLLFSIPEEKDLSIKVDAYIMLVKLLRTHTETKQITQNNFSLFSIYKAYNFINEYNSNIHCYNLDYINFYKDCAEFFNEIQMLHLSLESINKCNSIIEIYENKVFHNKNINQIQSEEKKNLKDIKERLNFLKESLNKKINSKKKEINNKLSNELNKFIYNIENTGEEKNYIINCKWYKKAYTYIFGEEQTEYPQEINNLVLLSKNLISNNKNNVLDFSLINKNKKEFIDYTYITKTLWDNLKDLFGFSNEIITSSYIQSVETQNIKILILDSTLMTGQLSFIQPLTITIPKNINVKDFKHQIQNTLNLKGKEISLYILSSNQKSVYKYFIFLFIYFFYSHQITFPKTKSNLNKFDDFHIPSELLEQYYNEQAILLDNNKFQNKYQCIIIYPNNYLKITSKDSSTCICGKLLNKIKLHYCIYCPEHIKTYFTYCSDICSQNKNDKHKILHQWLIPYQTINYTSKHLINDNFKRCFDITKMNGCKGLKNIGLTCYFNAAIQSLISCEILMIFLFSDMYSLGISEVNNEDNNFLDKLKSVFLQLKENSTKQEISPVKLVKSFISFEKEFQLNQQHDAGECLTNIINQLILFTNKSSVTKFDLRKVKNRAYYSKLNEQQFPKRNNECSVVNDLFYGQKKMILNCEEPKCRAVSERSENFLMLQLVVPKKEISFPDKLEINCKYFKNNKPTFTHISMKYQDNINLKTFKDLNKDLLFFCYVVNKKDIRIVKDEEIIDVRNSDKEKEFIIYEKLANKNSELFTFIILTEKISTIANKLQFHKKNEYLYQIIPNESSCFGDIQINKYPIIFTIHKDYTLKDFCLQLFGNLVTEEIYNLDDMNQQLKNIFTNNNEPISLIINENIFSDLGMINFSEITYSNKIQTNKNKCDIYDCLKITLKESVSHITCKTCKAQNKYVSIQESISFTPHYLVILLKRFYQDQNYNFVKNNREILFTDRLSLFDYIDTQSFATDTDYFRYDLISIIFHLGTVQGGHYITWTKLNDQWIEFDDSRVSKVNGDKIPSSSGAFVLLYKRKCIEHCLGQI
jgi:ubiquitin C-terminal hydrolase